MMDQLLLAHILQVVVIVSAAVIMLWDGLRSRGGKR